jgi:hypothetical protein
MWITWPSTTMAPVRFTSDTDVVDLPVTFRAGFERGSTRKVWRADLRNSPLPPLLVSRQGSVQVSAGGHRLGEVPLVRASEKIRAALKSCYRF